jgi:hypothetical protein
VFLGERRAWSHQETKGEGEGGAATDEESEKGGRSQSTMVTRKTASVWGIARERGRGHGWFETLLSCIVEGRKRENVLECLVVETFVGVRIRTDR